MKRVATILCAVVALISVSCAPQTITKRDAFPKMYAEKPLTILVLPPINETTAADAKEYYTTTLAEPISQAGYYILPIEVTNDVLKSEGLYDAELLQNASLNKFKDYFGADAVMFVRISQWDTSYYVIGGHVIVGANLLLRSTTTGQDIWKYSGVLKVDTSGGNSGGGLAGLLVKIIVTAINTAATDYMPVARQVSGATVASMPYGKYHPECTKDGGQFIIMQSQKENNPASIKTE